MLLAVTQGKMWPRFRIVASDERSKRCPVPVQPLSVDLQKFFNLHPHFNPSPLLRIFYVRSKKTRRVKGCRSSTREREREREGERDRKWSEIALFCLSGFHLHESPNTLALSDFSSRATAGLEGEPFQMPSSILRPSFAGLEFCSCAHLFFLGRGPKLFFR